MVPIKTFGGNQITPVHWCPQNGRRETHTAHPHHAYLFTNRRANRLKVLVHDGIGIWLAARRLNQGQFVWPHASSEPKQQVLTHEQLAGLVLGLPWQRIGQDGVIRII
ncbi:IS66 family insertion sequence element accessory protein TnpB [Caballeronia sp. LZ019]|uniref:IS66 family insertion sequence element accessory protein TnpB n=1 Tax=Caballeronia sp. LZ019 TaxID=3038555 RepID=UPI00285CB255|nr:IS66 family insertion sequence element accessory protein TnpB [Caballeronia sp. LZ019]MDR5809260.1 IS66 family insertion sequence element accessory protein TnpB [Caballeronia sp. LZ019]